MAFIFCPLLFIPGLAVGRFLLKSFPPRLSGKRCRWLLGYLIIMTIFWVISIGIGIFGFASEVPTVNNPAVSGFQGTKVPTINFPESSNFYRAARLFDSALYKGLQFMSALFWWFGFAIPLSSNGTGHPTNPWKSHSKIFVWFTGCRFVFRSAFSLSLHFCVSCKCIYGMDWWRPGRMDAFEFFAFWPGIKIYFGCLRLGLVLAFLRFLRSSDFQQKGKAGSKKRFTRVYDILQTLAARRHFKARLKEKMMRTGSSSRRFREGTN
jgi:hypothetical protein